jgi:hypothetical protein
MKPEEAKGFGIFWRLFGLVVSRLIGERAHAEVVLVMAEGKLQRVRINRSFLPGDIGAVIAASDGHPPPAAPGV